ncbi:hypothetical protein RUND412_011166 [Rhizina undulata]
MARFFRVLLNLFWRGIAMAKAKSLSEASQSEASSDAAMPSAIAFPAKPATPREPLPRKLLADRPLLKDPWGAWARRLADDNGREGGSQEQETGFAKRNHEQLMGRMADVVGDWR